MTLRLGLIGYGAIGKHIEHAGLDGIDLVSVLVKRPRAAQTGSRGRKATVRADAASGSRSTRIWPHTAP